MKQRENKNTEGTEMKKYMVISETTEISISAHSTKEEATKVAESMTKYHNKNYIVREV